jgi:hypothetical protein
LLTALRVSVTSFTRVDWKNLPGQKHIQVASFWQSRTS